MVYRLEWMVPNHDVKEFSSKKNSYCLCIPVINEGEKIQKQLSKIKSFINTVDVIILDGGSKDGSLEDDFLKSNGIRSILTKRDKGKLSAQLRMGFAYALDQGYDGVITMDGNNKDSVDSIPLFIEQLEKGFDFIQGSRYVPGGNEVNTPLSRKLAIKLIHAPYLSLLSGFRYTDTTNGFRGHSRRLLMDPRVSPFRDIFDTYELLAYLSYISPKIGMKVIEIPVSRVYPKGKIPTKISPIKGNMLLLRTLANLALRKYSVK
ncbi:glycosyltransferase family 2 protein [Paenibacillus sp. 2TAB23]|uniref:glycosyltransferase family 2 protein n=1 Tax=Paenibacillus sp. 2TAB23 TaxID=3233004 RepID=UPI003F9D13DA